MKEIHCVASGKEESCIRAGEKVNVLVIWVCLLYLQCMNDQIPWLSEGEAFFLVGHHTFYNTPVPQPIDQAVWETASLSGWITIHMPLHRNLCQSPSYFCLPFIEIGCELLRYKFRPNTSILSKSWSKIHKPYQGSNWVWSSSQRHEQGRFVQVIKVHCSCPESAKESTLISVL